MVNVKNIKTYLNLPYKYLDNDIVILLLVDILNGNGDNYSDMELEKIVKAFCYNQICKYYTNIDIIIMSNKELSKMTSSEVNGIVKNNSIYLKRENVLELRNKKVDILRTIFHESHHIKQRYMMEHNEINYRTFLNIMEQIICMKLDKKYYRKNYLSLFEEVDARIEAEFNLYDFLKLYCLDLLYEYSTEIVENVLECEEEFDNIYRDIDDIFFEREEIFDYVIEENPCLVSLFPILNFYYEVDGSKIPLAKILERRNEEPSNPADIVIFQKLKKLDKLIIKNRRGSKKNLQRDLISLRKIDDGSSYMSEIISSIVDKINGSSDDELYEILKDKLDSFKGKISRRRAIANIIAFKKYRFIKKERR